MTAKLLLTSFNTWLPEQVSNASDDLLAELYQRNGIPQEAYVLRKLDVDTTVASRQVLAQIEQIQPEKILCCGMAVKAERMLLESMAYSDDRQITLSTSFPLEPLCEGMKLTSISHDPGNFVCNGLYFKVLHYLQQQQSRSRCLFVHIPVLTNANLEPVVHDFALLIKKVLSL